MSRVTDSINKGFGPSYSSCSHCKVNQAYHFLYQLVANLVLPNKNYIFQCFVLFVFLSYTQLDQKNSEQENVDSYSTSRFHLRPPVHVERDLDPNQV